MKFNKKIVAKVVTIAVAGACIAANAPAQAASGPSTTVTPSSVKSIDYYLSRADYYGGAQRNISGTATNLTNPSIDLVCLDTVTGNVTTTISSGVTVTAGKWSTKIWTYDFYLKACRLAALPAGTSPTGETNAARLASTSAFTGPYVRVGEVYEWNSLTSTYGQVWQGDPGVTMPSTKANYSIWGNEDGGLYDWKTRSDGSNVAGNNTYGAGFQVSATGPSGNTEAGLIIDNKQAFTSYTMADDDNNSTAANSPKYSFSFSTAGILTYKETYPLFRCTSPEAGAVYSGLGNCPNYASTKLGVNLVRTITMSADGTIAKITNTFNSLDKKAHTVQYDEYWASYSNGYRYATAGTFVTGDNAITSGGTARTAIAGVGIKKDKDSATSVSNPITQIVFITKPTKSWTGSKYGIPATFSRWNKSIPAGTAKSVSIITGAALIVSDAEAAGKITTASK